VAHAGATGKGGWSFEGNALTTVIPVARGSVEDRITVEVRRAVGLAAGRNELDGFAGAMTRLRGAYDALRQTFPVSDAPDILVDAMQAGDRLGYHPEQAQEEIVRFHKVLSQAQAAVAEIDKDLAQRTKETDTDAQKQHRLDAAARAHRQVNEACQESQSPLASP